MSGIFGLLRFDDQPVRPEDLNKIKSGMAYWGPHGSALWQGGQIGLGHLLLRNTPESIYETSPLTNASGDLALTASARLDNRAELFQAFDIPATEQRVTPDVALILKAYERWGEDCVHHLLGDWAFGLWNAKQRKLFLARDHHGITSLFYYRNSRFFAFASSLGGLLALPQVPHRPNALRVAEVLVPWSKHGTPTAYEDLHRLPPAHCFTVSTQPTQPRRYWYLEHTPDLRLSSDADYVEAFMEIYSEAVRCRVRSLQPVGATVSGGLDSGSVSALAARELGLKGERLITFTSVPLFDTTKSTGYQRFGDESDYVKLLAQFSGHMEPAFINAEHISPLAGIERHHALHHEPGHAAPNMYWITAVLEEAQARGLGALLIGQDGNMSVSWTGGPLAPWHYLLTGQWGRFQRASMESFKASAFWQTLRRTVINPIRGSSLAGSMPLFTWENSAIHPALVARLKLRQYQDDENYILTYKAKNGAHPIRYTTLKPGGNIAGSHWANWGAGYGLEVRDPTADKRLLEFCLAIPNAQYRQGGQDRALIRRAMAGLLPDEIRLNTHRGQQAADIIYRVRSNQTQIESVLDRLERSALASEYLDLPKMRGTLKAAHRSADSQQLKKLDTILLRGLSVGIFLLETDTANNQGQAVDDTGSAATF